MNKPLPLSILFVLFVVSLCWINSSKVEPEFFESEEENESEESLKKGKSIQTGQVSLSNFIKAFAQGQTRPNLIIQKIIS